MKPIAFPLLVAVVAATLAACHVPDTAMVMQNGTIELYGDTVTLHVTGAREAAIDAEGGLSIDGKTVPITPAERALLAQYGHGVRAMHQTGLAMGKVGVKAAIKSIAGAASASDKGGTAADSVARTMQDMSLDICKDTAAVKLAQDRLATQLPAFGPYATILAADDMSDCAKDAKN